MGHGLNYTSSPVFATTGTTAVASVALEVDMKDYEGCVFYGFGGTTATVGTITVAVAASTTDSFVNLSNGTAATTGANSGCSIDIYRPRERWLRATLATTANSRVGLVGVRYNARELQTPSTAAGGNAFLHAPST